MKYRQWKLRGEGAPAAGELPGAPPLLSAVLRARGLHTPEQVGAALSCERGLLCDPMQMRDMDRACARMEQAMDANEYIAVYGDYDVDGVTATCLLTQYLQRRGARVRPYIPDRMEEGYGLSAGALEQLHEEGVTLIVTVDCGVTAVEEVAFARALGIDVVITDHHACKERLPDAVAVVNPQRPDCPYPFAHLAGVGVALKLVLALDGGENTDALLETYGDLAAIGTVADVMCLQGENRAIVHLGLQSILSTRRPGVRALLGGMEARDICASMIGFFMGPRINAAGRMGKVALALELLMTDDDGRAAELAAALCELNRERQRVESEIFTECVDLLERESAGGRTAVVLAGEGWHQGVTGIVASRLTERYSCPAFVICLQDGMGKGSCRSGGGINLFHALSACEDLLDGFGGHALAAGFTIREENIPAFRTRICEAVSELAQGAEPGPVLEVDAEIGDPAVLNLEGVAALVCLEPCGAGNPRPVLMLTAATVVCRADVGGGRHLKLRVSKGGYTFDCIFFSATAGECGLSNGDRVDVAFFPKINEYRGNRTVQLQVIDLRPALTRAQAERRLYEKMREGLALSACEARALTPSREEFVAVWRYLRERVCTPPLEETACRLAKCVARSSGQRESLMRTMVCLDVFRERGLIKLEGDTDHLRIYLNETGAKVDLEESEILKELKKTAQAS